MATDLTVKLTDGTGGTVYTLKVERIQHQMQRTPMTTPLPGDPSSGEPSVFQFDFGYNLEVIQVQGLVDQTGATQNGDVFPSASDLKTAMKTWWKDADFAANTGLMKLTIWTGESYYGSIRGFSIILTSGREDRYEFNFDFQVKESI